MSVWGGRAGLGVWPTEAISTRYWYSGFPVPKMAPICIRGRSVCFHVLGFYTAAVNGNVLINVLEEYNSKRI